jgi:hypothetical protein
VSCAVIRSYLSYEAHDHWMHQSWESLRILPRLSGMFLDQSNGCERPSVSFIDVSHCILLPSSKLTHNVDNSRISKHIRFPSPSQDAFLSKTFLRACLSSKDLYKVFFPLSITYSRTSSDPPPAPSLSFSLSGSPAELRSALAIHYIFVARIQIH